MAKYPAFVILQINMILYIKLWMVLVGYSIATDALGSESFEMEPVRSKNALEWH